MRGDEVPLLQRRYALEHARTGAGPAGHVIARSEADDDLFIELPDQRFALVHLTWSDDETQMPQIAVFATSLDALAAMRRDSEADV